jgi:cytochrome c-type biogenesis protein CcmH
MLLLPIAFLMLAVVVLLAPQNALAQTPVPPTDDDVNAIARELFCPICENTPLDVCPTEACRQWREVIRQMLAEGKSEEEIKQHFVDNYGARVLSAPPAKGINWLAYIVPPILFLGGVVALILAYRSWKSRKDIPLRVDTSTAGTAAIMNEYEQKLEDELKKRG